MLRIVIASILILEVVTTSVPPEIAKCMETITIGEIAKMKSLPGKDELREVCPRIVGLFNCLNRTIEELSGMSLKEIAEDPDAAIANGAKFFVNVQRTFIELCTTGTPLNTAYLEQADCFENLEDPLQVCEEKANTAYTAYKSFISIAVTEPPVSEDKECMIGYYKIACVSTDVMEKCGENAHALYLDLVKKTSFFKYGVCSLIEVGELKAKFLEYLQLNDDHKYLFAQAFDLKRRK